MSSSADSTNPRGRDIDLRWIFGNLFLWFGAGIIGFSFIDLFNGESLNLLSYIIPIVLIVIGIFMMKKSRNSAPIGEAYKAGMIYRGFRGKIQHSAVYLKTIIQHFEYRRYWDGFLNINVSSGVPYLQSSIRLQYWCKVEDRDIEN